MLCCRKKKREYEINPEDDERVIKQSQIEVNDDTGKVNGDVEAPVGVTVNQVTESVPLGASQNKETEQTGSSSKNDSGEGTEEIERGKNQKYVSQMSMCSSLSIREEINRSRDQFFSNTSLNDPSLQEDWNSFSKRLSRTDEKFAEYQRRLRVRKRLAEEEEMSAEQMQHAVSRLEAVASRLEALAVASPRPSVSSSGAGGSSGGPDPGSFFNMEFE